MSTAVETFAEWWQCTRSEYDADTDYVRSSQLKEFADCPTIYQSRYLKQPGDHGYMGPKNQSPEMRLGSFLHAWVLEGEKPWKAATPCRAVKKDGNECGNAVAAGGYLFDVDENVFVCAVHKRGRNVIECSDVLTPEQEEAVFNMAEAIERSEAAQFLLSDRFHEKAARSVDPETGVAKKALLDILKPRPFIIGDIKTTSEFNAESIWRKIDQNCWLISFAHYESVVMDIAAAKGNRVPPAQWISLVVESVPPYRVTDFHFDENASDGARKEYRQLLAEFSEAQSSGMYKQRPLNMAMPQWYMFRHGYSQEGSK